MRREGGFELAAPRTIATRIPILILAMLAFAVGLTLVSLCCLPASANAAPTGTATAPAGGTARPSTTGALHVEGTKLVDADGTPVVLRGVSTHGLRWYPEYVNDQLIGQVSREWDGNLLRLALYSESYSDGDQAEDLEVLHRGIEAAVAADMYVLVDWHVLEDGDPNEHIAEAREFFATIAAEYPSDPHIIYEICNEPNGANVTWDDIASYAGEVIPIIRRESPEAVIIVGTPNFDRDLSGALRDPLGFDNVMYSLHFYAASHGDELRGVLSDALDGGLPVFVSECGLSEESGDGRVDIASAVEWFDLLARNDVGYAVWNLSGKAESSALIRHTADPDGELADRDLTPVGLWVRSLIQGEEPALIPAPPVDPAGKLVDDDPFWMKWLTSRDLASARGWRVFALVAVAILVVGLIGRLVVRRSARRHPRTYDDLLAATTEGPVAQASGRAVVARVAIVASTFLTLVYLMWRICFSVPVDFGWLAVVACIILLIVEIVGFIELLIHYGSMRGIREHPLPQIADEDYPDVDIFIATYNEPVDLLRRTINGCNHLRYPDRGKVHVWVCDDNRRPEMRALAAEMGVGYFDRPDNSGAKAGNLNNAMAHTGAPYVVTFDADMIPRRDFLMKTIPYFVDAERRNARLPEEQRIPLGLLQTPQAFYQPDVFQHALYAETRVPNEQDFFYRTIEVAKTSTNSVIYGGSNTVLSRAALEAAGGFYTESITEDFATGLLLEAAGFASLAIPEPLASGRTPSSFREHIQQRTRWGRGVIVTFRKLRVLRRRELSIQQKLSYLSSASYWYSPVKNLVYLCSPLLFAVFAIPVLACSWLDLLEFWLPMFLAQSICLRIVSGSVLSDKWSGIHETAIMPHLLIPIVKESLGISLTAFKVTSKADRGGHRTRDVRAMAPFIVLLALSVIGIVRVVWLVFTVHSMGLVVLLLWLLRNVYFLVMALFLVDGRDYDDEPVHVIDAVPVRARVVGREDGSVPGPGAPATCYEGVATQLCERSMLVYLDFSDDLREGETLELLLDDGFYEVGLTGVVADLRKSRSGAATVHAIDIVDYGSSELAYLQLLYDRVPSLPQSLTRDFGIFGYLWRNMAVRLSGQG